MTNSVKRRIAALEQRKIVQQPGFYIVFPSDRGFCLYADGRRKPKYYSTVEEARAKIHEGADVLEIDV